MVAEQADPAECGFAMEAMQRPMGALGFAVTATFPAEGYFAKGAVAADPRSSGKGP